MDTGILPVKSLEAAKQRIADQLGDEARRALAGALLDDALVLCAAADWIRWWVVTADPVVERRARRAGLGVIEDPGGGLNPALRAGVAYAGDRGATSITILPADVPLGTRADLLDIFDVGATSDMVVVPALRDGGTNALYMSSVGLIEPAFGPHSLQAHLAHASAARLRCSILRLPRLELDIDRADDLTDFLKSPEAAETAAGRVAAHWTVAPAATDC
ncbi:MAG: 2-phospho-L-lactate guanylyltransferase [Actinomycetota bacterium]|nr:2-phospho-L-lactate guanylyltransferase [Actinomycetota bacterium]